MLKIVENFTVRAFYIKAGTKRQVNLINPSQEHLRRLNNAGYDITVMYYDNKNNLVKTEELKY